jgi:hypothetical protein
MPGLIVLRIVQECAWSMDALRRVGPRNVVLRGQAGRSLAPNDTDTVAMVAFDEQSTSGVDGDTKVNVNVV